MSDDIICLSSDDESPPPKRIKTAIIDNDVINKLNKLKEINFKKCEDDIIKDTNIEQNNITIVIESDDKSKENQNCVVNLTDEPFENSVVSKSETLEENNASGECVIIASDSETEDDPFSQLPTKTEKQKNVENGHSSSLLEKNGSKHAVSNDFLNRPSTSKVTEAHNLLAEFLDTCERSMKGSKYESRVLPKFSKMRENFEKCVNVHKEPNFMKMLREFTIMAKTSAPEAVVSFQRIYSYLLDNISGTGVEVSSEELVKLKKLEKMCRILIKRIKKLEEAEINFDDEEYSAFIQIDRYSKRLNKIYNKYCQLLKKSPYAGRLLYERIQFVSSKYNEINRAITKFHKQNDFPTYYDIEKCVRKCVTQNNLQLTETEIKEECKNCFTSLGKLLQMRRKKELYEIHCGFIALNEDPATQDENLRAKLQQSLLEGDKKMKAVVDKYVKMQEEHVNVELSEDSDDSNYKPSESDAEG